MCTKELAARNEKENQHILRKKKKRGASEDFRERLCLLATIESIDQKY